MIKTAFFLILKLLALALFIFLGFYFSQKGFDNIQKFRQIERTSQSQIAYTLTGEAKINAKISVTDNRSLLTSSYLKKQVVYFRYLKEREEKDGDGNTSWVTVTDRSRGIDFVVEDKSGKALVTADLDLQKLNGPCPIKTEPARAVIVIPNGTWPPVKIFGFLAGPKKVTDN